MGLLSSILFGQKREREAARTEEGRAGKGGGSWDPGLMTTRRSTSELIRREEGREEGEGGTGDPLQDFFFPLLDSNGKERERECVSADSSMMRNWIAPNLTRITGANTRSPLPFHESRACNTYTRSTDQGSNHHPSKSNSLSPHVLKWRHEERVASSHPPPPPTSRDSHRMRWRRRRG